MVWIDRKSHDGEQIWRIYKVFVIWIMAKNGSVKQMQKNHYK